MPYYRKEFHCFMKPCSNLKQWWISFFDKRVQVCTGHKEAHGTSCTLPLKEPVHEDPRT